MAEYQYEIIVDEESLYRLEVAVNNLDVMTSNLEDNTFGIADNTADITSINIPTGDNMDVLLEKLTSFMEKKMIQPTIGDTAEIVPLDNIQNSLENIMDKIEVNLKQNQEKMDSLKKSIDESLNLQLDESTYLTTMREEINKLEDNEDLKEALFAIIDRVSTDESINDLKLLKYELGDTKKFITSLSDIDKSDEDKIKTIRKSAESILNKIKDEQTRGLINRAFAEEDVPEPQFIISERKIKNLRTRIDKIKKMASSVADMVDIVQSIELLSSENEITSFSDILNKVKDEMNLTGLSKEQLTSSYFSAASDALTEAVLRFKQQFNKMDDNAVASIRKSIAELDTSIIGEIVNTGNGSREALVFDIKDQLSTKIGELAKSRRNKIAGLGNKNKATIKNIREVLEDTFKQIELMYSNFGFLDLYKIDKSGREYIDRSQRERKLRRLQGEDTKQKTFEKAMNAVMTGFSDVLRKGDYLQQTELFNILDKHNMNIIQKVAAHISGTSWIEDIFPSIEEFGIKRKGNKLSELKKEDYSTFVDKIEELSTKDMTDIFQEKLSKFDPEWFNKIVTGIDEELSIDNSIEDISSKINSMLSKYNDEIQKTINEAVGLPNAEIINPDIENFKEIADDVNSLMEQLKEESEISPNGYISDELIQANLPSLSPQKQDFNTQLRNILSQSFERISSGYDKEKLYPSIENKLLNFMGKDSKLMSELTTLIQNQFSEFSKEQTKSDKDNKRMRTIIDENKDKLSKIAEMLEKLIANGGNIH